MVKIQFTNLPDTTTPVNADNLNAVQTNTENAINEVDGNIDLATKTLLSTTSGKNQEITGCAGASGKINIESGETYQAQYNGNQLVDFKNAYSTSRSTYTFVNDILTVESDGTEDGGYNQVSYNITDLIKNNPDKTLRLVYKSVDLSNFNSSSNVVSQIVINSSTYTQLARKNTDTSLTVVDYTIPSDTSSVNTARFIIYTNNTSTPTASKTIIEEPMLQFGTETIPYEPYTATLPAPSPDYPQEIVNVGSNINLFDKTDTTKLLSAYISDNTVTSIVNRKMLYIPCKPDTYYTIQKAMGTSGKVYQVGTTTQTPADGVAISTYFGNETSGPIRTVLTDNTAKYLFVTYYYTSSDLTEQEVLDSIKIEEGREISSYTSYNEGSIDYQVVNKNIHGGFTFSKSNGGVDYTYNLDGTISINGKATTTSLSIAATEAKSGGFYYKLTPGTYIVSGGTTKYSIQIIDITGTATATLANTNYLTTAVSFTITEIKYVYLRIQAKTNETISNSTAYPMLEKGETASSTFIAHNGGRFSVPLPENMELCKIGTYKDYLYKSYGKWYKHKVIDKLILTGGETESWAIDAAQTGLNYRSFFTSAVDSTAANYSAVFCDKLINVADNYYTDTQGILINYASKIRIKIFNSSLTSVNALRTYLANNNLTIYYVLATPVEEEITDKDTIYYLEHFPIYKEYTSIECINDVKPDMHIDYLYDNEVNNYWGAELDSLAEKLHNLEVGE